MCEPRLEASPKARDSPTSASQGFFVQALAVGAAGSETGRLYFGENARSRGAEGALLGTLKNRGEQRGFMQARAMA